MELVFLSYYLSRVLRPWQGAFVPLGLLGGMLLGALFDSWD